MEQDIDSKVYEDTKDQQTEKCRIDAQIDDLDQEIAALEAQLALKRKSKEMLSLEKNVYEKQISQARSKYIVQINKQQIMKDKLIKKEESMNQDEEDYRRETKALAEYEEHFKSKLEQLEKELEDIGSLEVYLNNSNQKIELTVNEKRTCLEGQNSLK